jgi:DNA-binding response OmpR family regulator
MKHILVIEDEPQITNFLKRGLTYKGFDVMVACSGEQALNALLFSHVGVLTKR